MSKGAQTRELILDQALNLASTLGLEGLSIGGLAKEVGMSKSGLFAHFDSKEDLQLQVLQTAIDRFIAVVVARALRQPRGEPRVRALFENWLRWTQAIPGGCVFVSAANELDDRPGEPRKLLLAAQRDWLEALATAARIAVEEGHFRPDLDVEQFAYELYSVLLGLHHFQRLLRDPGAFDRARASFENLIRNSR